MGARAAGMGFASATLRDESALFNNVGAMAEIKTLSSFFAYEVRPSLEGSNRMAFSISIPTKFGVAGAGIFRFGDYLYSEQIISTGFSNRFGIASLGAKLNYIQYRTSGFGIQNAVSINFGGLAQITPQISVGAYITNINQARISEQEQLPTKLTAGLGFKPDDDFIITTEIEKDINYNATWRLGAEYTIHKKVFARTGFNLNPSSSFFGVGTRRAKLQMDYAICFNRILGQLHQVSVIYKLKNDIKK